jgi:hypothetical protein
MSEEQATYEVSEPKAIPGLIEGRNVHYVLPDGQKNAGQHRAAIICRVWDTDSGLSNLHVFWDGNNDGPRDAWLGSIYYSADPRPNTWHFMERA